MQGECYCCVLMYEESELIEMVNGDMLCSNCCDYALSGSGIVAIKERDVK